MTKRQKIKAFSFQGFDNAHYKATAAYTRAVNSLFDKATSDIADFANKEDYDPNKPFSFDDYPKAKARLQTTLKGLAKKMQVVIELGSRKQWLFACDKNDAFLSSIMDTSKVSKARLKKMQDRNLDALAAFQGRKVDGMNLSERVWKYTEQYKDQIEIGLDVGLGEGRSAQQLSRDLRQNLQDPNRLFRRVRDKRGNLHLSKAAKAFHPGTGVYRSSYKNAMRLTRSEVNMAYRESDHLRWQQLDFVVGFEVQRSNHEPKCKCKLCERLIGKYPKWFKFKGWHPQCLCYATAILMDEETFDDQELSDLKSALKGTAYKKLSAKNEVTDFPDGFKEWVEENAPKQAGWATTPYFIKDNFVDGDLSKGLIYIPNAKPLTLLEKAAIRHKNRTPEQVEAIQKRWAERKQKHALIKQEAQGVLDTAKDYSEVDFSALQTAIDAGDIVKMQSISNEVEKVIGEMQKQEEALSNLIPNVHEWHKQFSMTELQQTHAAVQKKLNDISGLPLAEQKKKLEMEIKYVEDPTYLKPHTQYPTWKVSQDAYIKKLNEVVVKIEIEAVEQQLAVVKAWSVNHPKSLNVANLLAEAQSASANSEDITIIKQKANLAIAEHQKRLAEQARRDAKNVGKVSKDVTLLQTDKDAYSQKRKDAAIWCKSSRESDDLWGDESDDLWNSLTPEQQKAWYDYTAGSGHMNRPLRGYSGGWGWGHYKGVGNVPLDNEGGEANIRNLKGVLDTTISTQDKWLQRGIETWSGVEGFIGVRNLTREQLRGMVGRIVTDYSFMSCGSAKGTGFSGTILNIYCPKGSKTFYAKRHSAYKSENETFMQIGATYRIIKVEAPDYGNVYIDIELIGYKEHPLL